MQAQPATGPRRGPTRRQHCGKFYSSPSSPNFSLRQLCSTLGRRLELVAQCDKKPPDEVLRHAAQNPLADAGDQAADFTAALKGQPRGIGSVRRDPELRTAIAVTQRAGARNLDAAGLRRRLVRE